MPAKPDWAEIVRANVAVVTNAALRVLGSVSDAEDVAQDVFLEAFRKFEPNAEHSWAGLLRRMAVCRSLDLLRCRTTSAKLVFQPIDFREPSVDSELLRQERHDQLRNAVQELPPREAEVFCLALFEQQSHEEIAATLGLQRGAVATLLSKAKSSITRSLHRCRGEAS